MRVFTGGKEETAITVEEMRAMDQAAISAGTPGRELMLRAAGGVLRSVEWAQPVAIMAGGGNNGGDGYALAVLLAGQGILPRVFQLSEKLTEDGLFYLRLARENGVPVCAWAGEPLSGYATVVDALLGTGFSGQVRSPVAEAISAINQSRAQVVSVDIPSGLNGNTGLGSHAVQASITVSIGRYKQGLFLGRGPELTGALTNIDIFTPYGS